MKITRNQLRALISERIGGGEEYEQPSFDPTRGPWAVMWRDLSRHEGYGHLMTQENKRIFKMAWGRAASSYDLNPERVGREMVSILSLRQIDPSMRPTVGPPVTGNPEIDMVLRGRSPIAEANREEKPAMKLTRRQLRRIIKEELSLVESDGTPEDRAIAFLSELKELVSGRSLAINRKRGKLYDDHNVEAHAFIDPSGNGKHNVLFTGDDTRIQVEERDHEELMGLFDLLRQKGLSSARRNQL